MIRVHLSGIGTAAFSGDFHQAQRAAHDYIRANGLLDADMIDDDKPPGISKKDWHFYCTPSKARITSAIQSAGRPLLTQEVSDAAKVCRTSACRILKTMEILGEARNVGVKTKAKWERV